ncbi:MAG: SUMF1/EgtB/PvdO family nonheme iron enzyme [Thermoanaerobaculia bacterium]
MARTEGGRLLPPWLLRGLALAAGIVGLALPAVVVKWVTASVPEVSEVGPLRPEMVVVPRGIYTIGGDEAAFNSLPLTEVELSAFAVSVTEVSREQYKLVVGEDPSSDQDCGPDCPVTDVCRFGNVADQAAKRDNPGWSVFECNDTFPRLAPVRKLVPNRFGLYDMTGNVWEWVWDWWGAGYEPVGKDPRGPVSGRDRVLRGGSFGGGPLGARVANRGDGGPSGRDRNLGFRVARSLP